MSKPLKPYLGHTPRDRGSIWYIGPIFMDIVSVLILLFIVAAFVFGRAA